MTTTDPGTVALLREKAYAALKPSWGWATLPTAEQVDTIIEVVLEETGREGADSGPIG